MRHSRAVVAVCGAAALAAAGLAAAPAGASSSSAKAAHTGQDESYVVLAKSAADTEAVAARLRTQGAKVTSVDKAIGAVVVSTDDANFRKNAGAVSGVQGVAADAVIGKAPANHVDKVEQEHVTAAKAGRASTTRKNAAKVKGPGADPLDGNLWGMRMIKADQAHTRTLGNRKVKVGIIDTGVQADHPDIHPNFDYQASRNFAKDMPDIDGPCEVASCTDPVGTDDGGHGTHVAGIVAASMNGFGLSGVAPKATIVEVKAGQDSGYFFLAPTMKALTYAGDAGLDVVNMSFYVDPWLYNCKGGAPEDSATQANDQDVIIATVNRALNYAHRKGVTLVSATGNENTDMANPGVDSTSPDYPADAAFDRTIDNDTCVDLPAEGPHVLGVNSLGPSGKKSDFSNYTTEPRSGEVELSAPGGWFRDGFGTSSFRTYQNEILSTYPLKSLQEERDRGRGRQRHPRRHDSGCDQAVPGHAGSGHQRVRVLRVAAGHLDGQPARRRRRGPGGRCARQGRGSVRLRAGTGQGAAAAGAFRHQPHLPEAPAADLHQRGARRELQRALRRQRGPQRVLRRGHRQRLRSGALTEHT